MIRGDRYDDRTFDLPKKYSLELEDVIAEAAARMSAGELRKMKFVNLPRAGAYMTARLRAPDYMCILALDRRGKYIGDKLVHLGVRWDFKEITAAVAEASDRMEAVYLILGISKKLPPEIIIPFDAVYRALLEKGVKILDLIEVRNEAFFSVAKLISLEKSDLYDVFIKK